MTGLPWVCLLSRNELSEILVGLGMDEHPGIVKAPDMKELLRVEELLEWRR